METVGAKGLNIGTETQQEARLLLNVMVMWHKSDVGIGCHEMPLSVYKVLRYTQCRH